MGINKNFVVRNGLEVANNLLYASDETNRVGINTAIPEYELEVIGDTRLDGAIVSTADTAGLSGQYIKSTGTGWEWDTFPRNRQAEKYTLVASQTRIPATGQFPSFTLVEYELTSVYLDGVKLTSGDYSINPGGDSITLFAAAFGGEEIEIIAHGATSVGTGNTGILGISVRESGISTGDPGRIQILDFVGLGVTLSGRTGLVTAYIDSGGLTDVQSDPSPLLGGYLGLNNKGIYGTGIVTATGFVGDGSKLTGITTLIKAGTGIYIDTFSGITTINASASGGSGTGYFDNDQTNPGIHTTSTHVGLGTTNPRFQTEIGPVGAAGTQLWVNGDARITGILTVGSSSIAIDGINDEIRIGAGFTLSADTLAQTANLQLTGIITATGFDGDLVGQHRVFTAGVSDNNDYDLAVFLDPTQGGHTYNRFDLGHKLQYNPFTGQLSNLGVTSTRGVLVTAASTFTSNVQFQGNIELGNNDQAIFGAGNDLRIYHDGSNSYIQDQGSGGLNLDANPSVTIGQYGTTAEMASFRVGAGVSLFYNNSKKFETTTDGVDITGTLDVNDDITIVGSSPTIKLQDTDSLQNYAYLEFDNSLDNTLFLRSRAYANTPNFRYQSEANGSINTNDIFTILGTGDGSRTHFVGVNSSNPDQRLAVVGNIKASDLLLASGTNITGVATATSFSGSGIGLTGMVDVADGTYGGSTVSPQITVADGRITGITATLISGGGGGGGGTEVIIEDNDTIVGTAGTINFGSGLSVSSATAGVVTVTAASAEVINDTTPQLGGNLDLNNRTINGTGNINITGSSRFNGPATCTSDLDVDGTATINALSIPQDTNLFGDVKNITVGNDLKIYSVSGRNLIITDEYPLLIGVEVEDGGPVTRGRFSLIEVQPENDVYYGNNSHVNIGFGTEGTKLNTTGAGVSISGICSATQFIGDGSLLTGISAGGSGTGYFDNNQTNPGIHTTASYVGLGTTNPRTPLQVEDVYGVYTDFGTFTASAGVTTSGDASWVIATDDFKTAEYTLYFKYNDSIQSQKVLVMNDGTTAYAQEYAIMYNNDLLVSVGASINSGTCELLWTPQTGVSGVVTYRVVRETML